MEEVANAYQDSKTRGGTVKKILALSIGLLLLPALVLADTSLLNYEKEAQVIGRAVCDNGKTTGTLYEHKSYLLDVVVTASGKTYLYFDTDNGSKYYIGSGSKAVEMEHEAWDAELKLSSPGYYALFHGGNHSCRKVN